MNTDSYIGCSSPTEGTDPGPTAADATASPGATAALAAALRADSRPADDHPPGDFEVAGGAQSDRAPNVSEIFKNFKMAWDECLPADSPEGPEGLENSPEGLNPYGDIPDIPDLPPPPDLKLVE